MKIFLLFLGVFCDYWKKYEKLKTKMKQRKLNPNIEVQGFGIVSHHEFLDFRTLSGGKMNLVLPQDPPTVVINQLPARSFRLDGTDAS